jgi:DNA-binding MarR family transcriptional regulator
MPKRSSKEYVSIPVDSRVILFNEIQKGDSFLFLYGQKVEKYSSYHSFLGNGLKNNELCLYAFEDIEHKWHPENVFAKQIENKQLHIFPINNLESLDKKIREMCSLSKSNSTTLRLLIDFCSLATPENIDAVVSSGKTILKTSKKIPITSISAFNTNSMNYETIGEVMRIYGKVISLSQTGELCAALPTFATIKPFRKTSFEAVSQETTETFVKNNLEIITLCLLSKNPMCGYDVIKTISQQLHCFLSQGTVYPLLYSLEKEKILKVEKNAKAKIYSLTEEGKKIVGKKIDEFKTIYMHMLGLIG